MTYSSSPSLPTARDWLDPPLTNPTLAGALESPSTHARASRFAKAIPDPNFFTLPDASTLSRFQPSARASLSFFRRLLWILVPSFIQSRLSGDSPKSAKLHPTAYLDGMRGLAAFAVFINHASYQTFEINHGFGLGQSGENAWPFQLPIIRLLYHGPPMVAIFFVISGYALSNKPLKLMRSRSYDSLMHAISSSAFRRGFRLYLPCFASTLAVAVLCQLGVYNATAKQFKAMRIDRPDHHAWTAPDPYTQLKDWALKMFDFVHPWDFMVFGGSIDLDRHLWTIPTEFRASMVLFLTHCITARMRPFVRIGFYIALIYWTIHWNRWEMILFFAGAALAEINLMAAERDAATAAAAVVLTPSEPKPDHDGDDGNDGNEALLAPPVATPLHHDQPLKRQQQSRPWRYFWYAVFVSGLYIASYPEEQAPDTPGYRTLSAWIPAFFADKARFWPVVAAVQIVAAVSRCASLRTPFLLGPVQYLGRISFALYLVHGPLIHTLGYAGFAAVWPTPEAAGARLETGFALVFVLLVCAVVSVADVFWRVVDLPCVRFARWLEGRVVVR